ncbi:Uncharacterised protein [Yersinia frederiksenii]|nr:Uncharacterised protein [Yersinia frederiksenii]
MVIKPYGPIAEDSNWVAKKTQIVYALCQAKTPDVYPFKT